MFFNISNVYVVMKYVVFYSTYPTANGGETRITATLINGRVVEHVVTGDSAYAMSLMEGQLDVLQDSRTS